MRREVAAEECRARARRRGAAQRCRRDRGSRARRSRHGLPRRDRAARSTAMRPAARTARRRARRSRSAPSPVRLACVGRRDRRRRRCGDASARAFSCRRRSPPRRSLALVVTAVIRRVQFAPPSARAQRVSVWLAAATDLADLELALSLVAGMHVVIAVTGGLRSPAYPALYGARRVRDDGARAPRRDRDARRGAVSRGGAARAHRRSRARGRPARSTPCSSPAPPPPTRCCCAG